MKSLILCTLCFCGLVLQAQNKKLPQGVQLGYVITATGDSLICHIKRTNLMDMQRYVTTYDPSGQRIEYTASQLARYYDGQYVRHAVRVDKSWFLLIALERGAATLYSYYYSSSTKIFAGHVIQKQGYETEKFDPNAVGVKKQIREYFNDYPPMSWDDFDRGYELIELQRLVSEYNQWVAKGKPKLAPPVHNPNQE